MVTLKQHMRTGEDDANQKARREALLYCIINHFDQYVNRDGGENMAETYRRRLTFDQKKRYRNMAYHEAVKLADGDMSKVNDPEIIVEAFFRTPLGKGFASQHDAWIEDIRNLATVQNYQAKTPVGMYMRRVNSWTVNNNTYNASFERTVISPYDPDFAKTDGLRDQLGYVYKAVVDTTTNNSFVKEADGSIRMPSNVEAFDSLSEIYTWTATDARKGDANYNHIIVEPSFGNLANLSNNDGSRVQLASDKLVGSGYWALADYVVSTKTKSNLYKAMGLDVDSKIEPLTMTADEREYMNAACKYMSSIGYEYDISWTNDEAGNIQRILLKTKSDKYQITLYDKVAGGQGQIFRNGIPAYIRSADANSTRRSSRNASDAFRVDPADYHIKMAALQWYFGDRVRVYNTEDTGVMPQAEVGVKTNIDLRSVKDAQIWNLGPSAGSTYNTVKIASSRSDNHSVLLGFMPARDANGNIVGKKPYYMDVKPSYATVISDNGNLSFMNSMFISDATYGTDKAAEKFGAIPVDKILSADMDVDFDGNSLNRFNLGRGADGRRDLVESGRLAYYRDVILHKNLTEWVERAKSNHAELMNIETIISLYDDPEANEAAILEWMNDAAGDTAVSDLKRTCVDILEGRVSVFTIDDDDLNEDSSIEIEVGSSLEDRINGVREYYNKYVNTTFGSVPELAEPEVDANGRIVSRNGIVRTSDDVGFVPGNVIKYTRGDVDYGNQNTSTLLRYMVYRLGENYDVNDFIKGDSYSAVDMKNRTIHYNPDMSLGTISRASIVRVCNEARVNNASITPVEVNRIAVDYINQTLQAGLAEKGLPVKDMSVTAEMMLHTVSALRRNGVDGNTITLSIDDNGVMHYSGEIVKKRTSKIKPDPYRQGMSDNERTYGADGVVRCEGDLGQIFEPDAYGAIHMKTVVPSDKVYVPGYTATILPNDSSSPTPINKRLRLHSWKNNVKQAISREIRESVFAFDLESHLDPKGAALNSVLRKSYGESRPIDDYRRKLPKDPDHPTEAERLFLNILKSEALTAHLGKEFAEGATTNTQASLDNPYHEIALYQDYGVSDLVDNNNLRAHPVELNGIVDDRHRATGMTQGTNLHLVEHVVINPVTGLVSPSPVADDKSPLLKHEAFEYLNHTPAERAAGATGNAMKAIEFMPAMGCAMMNCGGDTFEDGNIIRAEAAERYLIRSADGTLRPLVAQDKSSNMAFNKGVHTRIANVKFHTDNVSEKMQMCDWMNGSTFDDDISFADVMFDDRVYHVEFDKDSKESRRLQAVHYIQKMNDHFGIDDRLQVFIDNPDVDVIMSPYSGLSRFDGSTFRDMRKNPKDLVVNGKTVKGGIGHMYFIEHDMRADVKTHIYGDQDSKDGKGRKASSQIAWILQARNADAMMSEFFGGNSKAMHNAREYCIAIGLDLDQDGKPVVGYHDQGDSKRKLIKLPSEADFENIGFKSNMSKLIADASKSGQKDVANAVFKDILLNDTVNIEKDFMSRIESSGGFLELPFQLEFSTVSQMSDASKVKPEDFRLLATGQSYTAKDGSIKNTYAMPILSHAMRSGLDLADGSATSHNYTNRYINIYKNALKYMAFEREMLSSSDENYRNMCQQWMDRCVKSAQSEFNSVTNDVIDRKFSGKNCFARDEIMSNTTKRSGTAVWSPDPRLNVDEISMSYTTAKKLGLLGKNAHVVVWRDPATKPEVLSYMKVKVEPPPAEVRYNDTLKSMQECAAKNGDAFDVNKCKPVQFTFDSYTHYPPLSEANLRKKLSENPAIVDGLGTGNNIPAIHDRVFVERTDAKGNVSREEMSSAAYNTLLVDHPEKLTGCNVFDVYRINDHDVPVQRGTFDTNGKFAFAADVAPESEWIKVVDFELHGVRVHPAVAAIFNGDFDGDTVAIVALDTEAAKKEAREKFSRKNNLLNKSSATEVDLADYPGIIVNAGINKHYNDPGADQSKANIYPLFIQPSLEMASHLKQKPELKEEFTRLTVLANNITTIKQDLDANRRDPKSIGVVDGKLCVDLDPNAKRSKNVYYGYAALNKLADQCLSDINTWVHESMDGVATDSISFESDKSMAASLQSIVDNGAKGDNGKLRFLMDNIGIDYDTDDDGRIRLDTIRPIVDANGNPCTRAYLEGRSDAADYDSNIVAAYKADNTALGGRSAQLAVMALRDAGNEDTLTSVLYMTEPTTQAILQSKHDPLDAMFKDKIVRCWGKDVLNGYKLTGSFTGDCDEIRNSAHNRVTVPILDEHGHEILDEYGRPAKTYAKCTRDEWITQVKGMVTALKVDVNDSYIEEIADVMLNPNAISVESTNGTRYDDAKMYKDCVLGFEDHASMHGSLIDRFSYGSHRLDTFVNEAYVPMDKRDSIYSNAADVARSSAIDDSSSHIVADKSATFAPTSFVKGHANGKPVVMGLKDTLIVADAPAEDRVSYFGESRSDYELRMQKNLSIDAAVELKSKSDSVSHESQQNVHNGSGIDIVQSATPSSTRTVVDD